MPQKPPFRFAEQKRGKTLVLPSSDGQTPFPLPVSLLAEAMAQAILYAQPPQPGEELFLAGLSRVELFCQVWPGDRVELEVEAVAHFGKMARFFCRGFREGQLVIQGEVTVGRT